MNVIGIGHTLVHCRVRIIDEVKVEMVRSSSTTTLLLAASGLDWCGLTIALERGAITHIRTTHIVVSSLDERQIRDAEDKSRKISTARKVTKMTSNMQCVVVSCLLIVTVTPIEGEKERQHDG